MLPRVKDGFYGDHEYPDVQSNADSTGIGMAANTFALKEKFDAEIHAGNVEDERLSPRQEGAMVVVKLPLRDTEESQTA